MKHFRTFFILSVFCLFNLAIFAQVSINKEDHSTQLCLAQGKAKNNKTIDKANSSTQSLTVTKQRRLKSSHNYPRMNRKRKIVPVQKMLALKD